MQGNIPKECNYLLFSKNYFKDFPLSRMSDYG